MQGPWRRAALTLGAGFAMQSWQSWTVPSALLHHRSKDLAGMEDTTVPPAAAQEIITATTLLNNPQQCHRAAAHFTKAFRAAPQLADAFAEKFAEAADKLAAHRAQHKSGDEEWRAVAGSYLACINTCPADALLLTRLGVAAHARGKLVEARAAFVKAATLDDAVVWRGPRGGAAPR